MRTRTRTRCTEPVPNVLRTAVVGDAGDRRTLRLTGVESLAGDPVIVALVWQDGAAASTSLPVEVVDADTCTVEVDLGEWLNGDPAPAVDEWLLEIHVGAADVTWPDQAPAVLPVRAGAPAPAAP